MIGSGGRGWGRGRSDERKTVVARSQNEENAMCATWLALWVVTSVLDEDPQAAQMCVHVRV